MTSGSEEGLLAGKKGRSGAFAVLGGMKYEGGRVFRKKGAFKWMIRQLIAGKAAGGHPWKEGYAGGGGGKKKSCSI